jgi:propanol-preferring alcohol dehydrogenase
LLAGFKTDGFFAEYAAVDYRGCIKIPTNLDVRKASPIFCAGMTAFNSVVACECKPGDWVAIIGCGGLGQMAILYCKAMEFNVVAIDINDDILDVAKSIGADLTFNSRTNPNYIAELKSATGGGAEAVIVYSGSIRAYEHAHETLQVNGVLMVVGLPPEPMKVSTHALMMGSYRIKAETTGPPWKLPKGVEFTAKHNILPPMSFYTLDDIKTMIEKMQANDLSGGRMVVTFD